MEEEIVLQPYGKDSFYFNLVAVSENDEWMFGPSDLSDFSKIQKSSIFHSYLKIEGKNPKYHKFLLEKDFTLKKETKELIISDSGRPSDVNEIYIFIIYDVSNGYIYMQYCDSYEEFLEVKKNFNVIGSFLVVGDSLSITKEKLQLGIECPYESIAEAIEEIKNDEEEDSD